MEHGSWLSTSLVYLAAAVLAVPLARLLGLGAIIGYLGAGIVIGPWGLKLVTDPQTLLHAAEFGVVLMLFLVGLELEPRRLWALRRPIFGWGSAQLLGSAALLTGMRFLPPMVLHGAHRAGADAIAAHAALFADRLRSYPAWPELAGLEDQEECEVPANARPTAG